MKEKEHLSDNQSTDQETEEGNMVDNPKEAKLEANQEEQSEAQSLQQELDKLSDSLEESKDKYLRLYSEFENFRRRTAKERLDLINSANADLISALLPVLDDFERAQKAAEGDQAMAAQIEGMNLIYHKLLKELEQKGLKPMDNLVGSKFDAEMHEAISQIPAPKKNLVDRIVDVVEKGYYLNDKVIRYAKVVIGT